MEPRPDEPAEDAEAGVWGFGPFTDPEAKAAPIEEGPVGACSCRCTSGGGGGYGDGISYKF
jgi:hypothetical protein